MFEQKIARRPFTRVAGAGAIGFAFIIVAANLVLVPAGMPNSGAEPSTAAEFFRDHAYLTDPVAMFLPAAWVAATLFAAGAATLLATRPDTAGWAWTGFAGVVLQNMTFTGIMAVRLALSAEATPTLWTLHDALFGLNGTFLALAMLGFSVAGLRTGFIRRGHALLGLVAAALQFTSASLTPLVMAEPGPLGLLGLIGWLLWVAWLVRYGVALLRAHGELPVAARAVADEAVE